MITSREMRRSRVYVMGRQGVCREMVGKYMYSVEKRKEQERKKKRGKEKGGRERESGKKRKRKEPAINLTCLLPTASPDRAQCSNVERANERMNGLRRRPGLCYVAQWRGRGRG